MWPLALLAAAGVWWWTRQRRRLRRPRQSAEKSSVVPDASAVEKRLSALEVRLFDYERQLAEGHATRVAILEQKIAEATAAADRLEKAVADAAEMGFTVKLPEAAPPATPRVRDVAALELRQAGYDDDQIEILLARGWDERRAA
ncbi:MAG: hypothetical protein AAF532_04160 [Planctomycetota bacterium]